MAGSRKTEMTDRDVLIIGGGPSGVAAGLELRRQGVTRVTLLDREPTLGGATRHCLHSPFGMREFGRVYIGAAYGRRLDREAAAAGLDVRTGHSVVSLGEEGVVTVTSARGVETLSARRVLVTTGAREMPRAARLLPGDRPVGILTTGALQAFVAFHGLMPFRRPLIVGSELVTQSAVLTCLTHGARPVAVVEAGPQALVRAPLGLFPGLMGIPFWRNTHITDIRGGSRVEAVTLLRDGQPVTVACDGVLLTGSFTPESALLLPTAQGVDPGTGGPAVDQSGRGRNPLYFAAGNVLRAVETGGWAFREGRAVGAALAADLRAGDPVAGPVIPVTHDDPVKLVMPSLLRRDSGMAAFRDFQVRFRHPASGVLSLEVDGREVWRRSGHWMPERRVLIPIPGVALMAERVHVRFR